MKYRPGWAAIVIVAENAVEDLTLRTLHRMINPADCGLDSRPMMDQEKSGYAKLILPTGE